MLIIIKLTIKVIRFTSFTVINILDLYPSNLNSPNFYSPILYYPNFFYGNKNSAFLRGPIQTSQGIFVYRYIWKIGIKYLSSDFTVQTFSVDENNNLDIM